MFDFFGRRAAGKIAGKAGTTPALSGSTSSPQQSQAQDKGHGDRIVRTLTALAGFALAIGGTLVFSEISHDTTTGLETTVACAVIGMAISKSSGDPKGPAGLTLQLA
ncbi:hypothetical protein [Kitasatospora purpeofusca]|uniref:hypothetical protein n=1 Tax=Kitasatospora purpeofusca TaxID=67352 RepID=UPI00380A1FFE